MSRWGTASKDEKVTCISCLPWGLRTNAQIHLHHNVYLKMSNNGKSLHTTRKVDNREIFVHTSASQSPLSIDWHHTWWGVFLHAEKQTICRQWKPLHTLMYTLRCETQLHLPESNCTARPYLGSSWHQSHVFGLHVVCDLCARIDVEHVPAWYPHNKAKRKFHKPPWPGSRIRPYDSQCRCRVSAGPLDWWCSAGLLC